MPALSGLVAAAVIFFGSPGGTVEIRTSPVEAAATVLVAQAGHRGHAFRCIVDTRCVRKAVASVDRVLDAVCRSRPGRTETVATGTWVNVLAAGDPVARLGPFTDRAEDHTVFFNTTDTVAVSGGAAGAVVAHRIIAP